MTNLFFGFTLKDGLLDSSGWVFAENEDEAKESFCTEDIDGIYIFELPPEDKEYFYMKCLINDWRILNAKDNKNENATD